MHEWSALPALAGGIRLLSAEVRIPPFGGFSSVWAGRLAALAVFIVFQASSLSAGRRLRRFLGGRPDILVEMPAGWTVVGLAGFGAALAGIAKPAIAVAIALAMLPGARGLLHPRRGKRSPAGAPGGLVRAVLAVCGILLLLACLAPETSVDPLTYHYDKPVEIMRTGRFVPRPSSYYDFMPSLWEMTLMPLLAAGGEGATRWFNPLIVAALSAGVWRLARRAAGTRWAWGAAALFASNPFVAREAVMAKNDLFVAALGMAGVLSVLSRGGAPLAGWLAGSALSVKYSTGGYTVPALAAALMAARRRRPRAFAAAAAGFAPAALPALLNAWLQAGDPVYPAGHRWFASPWFSDSAAVRLQEAVYGITRQDPEAVSKWRNLEGLWTPTEESFIRWAVFVPALLLVPSWSTGLRVVAAFGGVFAAAWTIGPPPVRFGAPLFPAGAVLAAAGLSALGKRAGPRLLGAALVLQAVHFAAEPGVAGAWKAGAGLEDPEGWRAARLTSTLEAARALRGILRPGDRVLVLGDSRVGLFDARADFTAFARRSFLPFDAVHDSRSPAGVWKRIRQRGWTVVVYNRLAAYFWSRSAADDPWTAADLERWARVWRAHAEQEWESPTLDLLEGYYYVWRLVPRPRRNSAATMPGLEGWVWRTDRAFRSGDEARARAMMAGLRGAAGDLGHVDAIEAEVFRSRLDPAGRKALLERAVARGWRSPGVCRSLAEIAAREGRLDEARRWWNAALAIEPGRPK